MNHATHCEANQRTSGKAANTRSAFTPASGVLLQRKVSNSGSAPQSSEVPRIVSEVLQSPGQPLDASTRAFIEPRLAGSCADVQGDARSGDKTSLKLGPAGDALEQEADRVAKLVESEPAERTGPKYDLSRVRIHADDRAAASARAINAAAYTVGNHVVFGDGRYAPHTRAGRRLLAHELTHVGQQRQLGCANIVQRAAVEYVEKVSETEPTAAQMFAKFDKSVAAIEQNLKTQTGTQMTDLNAALARLKALRAANKVAVWRMKVTGMVYAAFDSGSGEMRLNISYPDISTSESVLVHEAIHSVHTAANPEIADAYAKGLKSGGPSDAATTAVLLKWKAWTEYWAYRRSTEYSAGSKLTEDPEMGHRVAIANPDFRAALNAARASDPNFDPKTWQPTAADKATALRFTGKAKP